MFTIPVLLQSYLSTAYPQRNALKVTSFETMNSGWESDVHRFTVEYGDAQERVCEDLVLRIYPGMDAYEKSMHEYESMVWLRNSGYPVPCIDLLERESSPFGKPFLIMEQIKGKLMTQCMFRSTLEEQQKMLGLFCQLFSRLHALDWRSAVSVATKVDLAGKGSLVVRQLTRWQSLLSTFPTMTGFQANWDWLVAHQNEIVSQKASPVHWDFHTENILIKDDGSAVVIDWTSFEITDYRFDLAWSLLLMGSHYGFHWRELILREYERQVGHEVADLAFFDVAACMRRLVSVIVSLKYGADKLGMRPGAEQTMRNQAHALRHVYELLLARTGLAIPEVEQFLNEASSKA